MKKNLNLLFAFFLVSYNIMAQTTTFTPTVISMSDSEILNPGRGFFRWNGEEVAPYPSIDRYKRYKWSDIETSPGVYNFSVLDAEAAAAAADPDGKGKFSFGVRCVVEGSTRSYPTYLDGLMTSWYSTAKSCWVPDWNDADFLTRVDTLMKVLGARYNNDPRIGYIEIRTYGNWGEWHMSGFETTTPVRPSSVVNITESSINSIIDSHVNYFHNKQIIMMSDNDYGLGYAMSKTGLTYPIGWRRDSWCYNPTFSQIKLKSAWTTGGGSTRWKTAPVILEGYRGEKMRSDIGYQEVIDYHGSAIGNGNFIAAWNLTTQGFKDTMLLCAKTSGYRFIIRSVTHPTTIIPGQNIAFNSVWSNVGVAPLYEDRNVIYRISNIATGTIVWSGTSTITLRGFLPTYNYTTQVDSPVTINDSFSIPTGITQGTYSLDVLISDPTGYSNPLNLAITGRNADGAYALGTITIATVPTAPTGIVATAGNAQASVAFNTPYNGGSPITSYTVYKYVNAIRIMPGVTASSSPIVVTGLTNGTTYTFRVLATNAIGNSRYSSASNAVTPTAPSSASGITTSFETEIINEPIISTVNGNLSLKNLPKNSLISVYDEIGRLIAKRTSINSSMEIKIHSCSICNIIIQSETNKWIKRFSFRN